LHAPGDQDEIPRGRRRRGEAGALIVDEQAPVEAFAELDPAARVRAAVGAARDLDQPGPESHGIVVVHAARVATAEAVRQIARRPTPGGRGGGGWLGEAAVVVGQVGGQVRLGRGDGLEAAKAELGDEAIL
jgi:hypothetical protein